MSLAMRNARLYAKGDPGLFGFLGGVVKGAVGGFLTGGPAGAILGGAAGAVSGIAGRPISVAKTAAMSPVQIASTLPILRRTTPASILPPLPSQTPTFSGVQIGGPSGVQVGTSRPGVGTAVAPTGPGVTGALVGAGAGTPCVAGYHYNKSRYYSTRYGVVEKGSVCVKNRRRNPLNPRALSRAMSRVKSAQKAVRCLQLFAGPAARASSKARSNGKSGCKSCKRR